jgi:dTDP-4-amino-4,6-dideoxygalactose transaminase
VISFNTNKAVAGVNGGGMALTDLEHLAQVIRQLSRHGRRGSDSEFLGYNSRLYCLNSEIISLRLQHMWEWQRSRQAVAHTYNQAFADLPLVTQRCTEQLNHNFHKYVVGFPDQLTRNRVQKALNAAVHYDPPLNAHTMYASMPHRSDGKCAVANWVSQRVLSLPVHPWLLPEEIDHVIATVRNHV